MECDESNSHNIHSQNDSENADTVEKNTEGSPSAVNSIILDYYKKFGRKRDLEQYFSLSTAQGEVRDPTGLFWTRMKSQIDSSDSGEKKSESSTELCRISIKCTVPEPSASSPEEESRDKSESVSPPIITEDVTKYSDGEESAKSDNHSQKSIDFGLDTSMNKPFSPTSSITSQRKLEWDSLADVGYGNESDRKTSGSGLSTLEKLALKQQYSNNDTKQDTDLGAPTAHSTFLDQAQDKIKDKKSYTKKTTIHNRDIDLVKVDLPQGESHHQAISVNLTKHISFNVEKDGGISIGCVKKDLRVTPEKENLSQAPEYKDLNVTPEKVSVDTEVTSQVKFDKEIQTTFTLNKETAGPSEDSNAKPVYVHKVPVLINLNTLKKRNKKKKLRTVKKRLKARKRSEVDKENVPTQEKSGAQVSEAESFEYMPGHMYNQNQNQSDPKFSSGAGNKSSLESSGALTTDSSKTFKPSFTKDLEKCIDMLKVALKHRYDDKTLKKKLITDIVQRLLKSNYRDDDTTTDFLSGLSFGSKKIGLSEGQTTSSTSDGNQSGEKGKLPKKSILRLDRFNSSGLASTSQSAPNLPVVSTSEKPISSKLPKVFSSSNTESDVSSKKNSSDVGFAKTSSEELYQKYLEALKKEEAYKRHLKDKENFLRHKLVSSDAAFKIPVRSNYKGNSKLQDLLKDLTRNNYDDGSGDASKLEGGVNSYVTDYEQGFVTKNQQSHSVFTLSSANSDSCQHRKNNLKKKLQQEIKESRAGGSKDGPCQCGLHMKAPKIDVADSSVQVNIQNNGNLSSHEHKKQTKNEGSCKSSPREAPETVSDIKYVCLCAEHNLAAQGLLPNMYIYKCSRITDEDLDSPSAATCNTPYNNNKSTCYHVSQPSTSKGREEISSNNKRDGDNTVYLGFGDTKRNTQSSQTNVNMATRHGVCGNITSLDSKSSHRSRKCDQQNIFLHEATRCIQTEISINTRISDPCLNDINIVSERECCTVVNENYRMISKPNSDNELNNVTDCCVENKESDKQVVAKDSQTDCNLCIRSNNSNIARTLEKEVQSDMEINIEPASSGTSEKNEDNFSIPIKGTNMTLLVSIGANRAQSDQKTSREKVWEQKNSRTVCEGTTTEEINVAEKATCLTEECSKGVQSQETQIFTPKRQCDNSCSSVKSTTECFPIKDKFNFMKKSCIVNTCIIDKKAGTYPRTVQINDSKPRPFVRSNTDSGRFIAACYDLGNENEPDIGNSAQEVLGCGCAENSGDTYGQESKDVVTCGTSASAQSSKNSCDCKDQREASDGLAPSCKSSSDSSKDPIVDIIKDITRRYSKKDVEKSKRKKCFKEIVTVLNYLLDTDDGEQNHVISDSSSSREIHCREAIAKTSLHMEIASSTKPIEMVDKGVQLNTRKSKESKCCVTESSELPSSSDTATCRVLNKIKKECEKYHQRRCKCNKKYDLSSSTSNCNQCQHVHHCHCRSHKCKGRPKITEKVKKKCLAYNLIIQTSDSMVSDEIPSKNCKPLQHIVVKVPPKNKIGANVPFKEVYAKIEKNIPSASPRGSLYRSRSCPNESEVSSECNCTPEECTKKCKGYTVRDYLEKNRPDFVERSSDRQNCLKTISEKRANERAAKRQLLSLQLEQPLSAADDDELRQLAKELGAQLRRKKLAPKFISEKEMKKHSEKIYKSLPEVVEKKERNKKENIKKTNLLMAYMFKKNLQKNTLRGAVNLSNYSTVIKI